ncbi:MAG: SurA N-terminal domain-containing protein [Anaerolineales bacterium]|nr:SurA N-terminal domain-containing protein [Anaerolineales bacterium]
MKLRTPLRYLWWGFIVAGLLVGCNMPDANEPPVTPSVEIQAEVPVQNPTETQPEPTPTTAPDPAAAIVNGEEIGQSIYQAHLARYQDAQAQAGTLLATENVETSVLDDLIARLLLAQGARAGGFVADDVMVADRVAQLTEQVGGTETLAAWMQAHHYTEESFRRDLKLELEAAWMRDQIANTVPENAEQVLAREILFYNEVDAIRVYSQLEGGSTFESRIENYDPNNLGYLGWFPRGYLLETELEEVAFSLQPGQYSEVIESRLGFHILQVLDYAADRPLSADARLTLQTHALEDWLAQKRAESQIEIFLP